MWGGGEWGDQLHQLFSLGRSGAGKLLMLPELLVLPRALGRAGSSRYSELPARYSAGTTAVQSTRSSGRDLGDNDLPESPGTWQQRWKLHPKLLESAESASCLRPCGAGACQGSQLLYCLSPAVPAHSLTANTTSHRPQASAEHPMRSASGGGTPSAARPCHAVPARLSLSAPVDAVAAGWQDLPRAQGAPCRTRQRGAGAAMGSSAC